jgi:hypothetical protein
LAIIGTKEAADIQTLAGRADCTVFHATWSRQEAKRTLFRLEFVEVDGRKAYMRF